MRTEALRKPSAPAASTDRIAVSTVCEVMCEKPPPPAGKHPSAAVFLRMNFRDCRDDVRASAQSPIRPPLPVLWLSTRVAAPVAIEPQQERQSGSRASLPAAAKSFDLPAAWPLRPPVNRMTQSAGRDCRQIHPARGPQDTD